MLLAWIMSLNILWLKRLLLFIFDNWKLLLLVLAGVIVFFWVFSFGFCGNGSDKKADAIREEILTERIESNIAANQVREAENTSARATRNVNAARQTNINTFSVDYFEARKRFCAEFPRDCPKQK